MCLNDDLRLPDAIALSCLLPLLLHIAKTGVGEGLDARLVTH